ncbi:MAG: alpha-mannosidase [Kiritimatiellia bacterium]|nr:glycosyl hydrolase-related protein [Lentisphaerota bacterium]
MIDSSKANIPEKPERAWKAQRIHAICAQHLDVAWLWPRVPHGEDLMRQCFERAVEMIEAHPGAQFVFSRSTAWSFQVIERQCPELFEKVRLYVRDGRIALCGGQWVEPDHVIPSGEALVRQAALAQWYFLDKFGKTARVCWALDNFAHAGSLPQILSLAGMDGYYLGRCLPQGPDGRMRRQFVWKGWDGTEIMAFKLWNCAGGINAESIRQALDELDADGLPAIIVKADDLYSDRRVTMSPDLVPQPARVSGKHGLPACRWSAPDEVVEDMQGYRDLLPVVEGELGFEYTGTYTTDGRYKRRNRFLENLMCNAEKAACWAALHGFPYPVTQFKQAWSDLCLNQFHDLSCGTCFGEVLEEADRLNTGIEGRAQWALDQALAFLCDRWHAELQQAPDAPEPLAVFNLLSFEHTAPVCLPRQDDCPAAYHDEQGRPVPSQTILRADGARADLILHESRGMAAGLYRRTPGEPVPAPSHASIAGDHSLENEFVRVEFDPGSGEIVRLLDKARGRECLPAGGRGNRLELLAEGNLSPHPDWCTMEPWWIMYTGEPLQTRPSVSMAIRDDGPLRGCVRVCRRIRFSPDLPETVIIQDIALYRHSPLLHFETHGVWHAERVMLKARFDLPFTATRVAADAPYGVAERRLPQHLDNNVSRTVGIGEEWKEQRDLPPEPDRCMQTWLDVSDGQEGLLILNNGRYGYDADEKQVGLSLLRSPNMRPWRKDILGLGPFEFSYAVMPHPGDWRAVDAPRLGQSFNNPPVVRTVRSGVDDLAGCQWWDRREDAVSPVARGLVDVREAGLQVTAIKRAEDGAGWIFRLLECHGARRQAKLRCCRPVRSVLVCDLLERALPDAAGVVVDADGAPLVELAPYEIKTLRVCFD